MNHSNTNHRYNRNIILASTVLGAALGYFLFGSRRAALPRVDDQPDSFQVHPGIKPPVLVAPLSPTIH